MPTAIREDPFKSAKFRIEIDGIITAAFLSVSGIDVDVTPSDYRNGNDKTSNSRKLPGEAKFSNLILRRGITKDLSLWQWMQQTFAGQLTRKNMAIVLLNDAGEDALRFTFVNAWPVKWTGPSLNAESNDVAIETLEITHEGLSLSV